MKILTVKKTIPNDISYSQGRILKNDTDEIPNELFTEQMNQEIDDLVNNKVKLLLIAFI